MATEKSKVDRVPRELMHEQDDRLTNKHIQTLAFLQDLANENKTLKARVKELEENLEECKDLHNFAQQSKEKIKDIQESYMAKADEINMMLSEKHRADLMQVQEDKLEMERELKEQILKLRQEIGSLRDANKDLRDTALEEEESNETKKKLKEAIQELNSVKEENEELKEELESVRSDLEIFQAKKASDMSTVKELKDAKKQLEENLQELQQKCNELEFNLDKTVRELKEKSNDQEQTKLIEDLRDKVQQLTSEREASKEREARLGRDLMDLSALKDEMKEANIYLQNELEKLLNEYGILSQEYDRLRKRSMKDRDNKTFKDFVALKRELKTVQYENEHLKMIAPPPLVPMLKDEYPPSELLPKRNSLDGKRKGAKKLLAISMGNQNS